MGKKILFSPIGGTDPIKYDRDGSMLHICRHYMPDEVIMYMSKEIVENHKKDNRYVKSLELLGELMNHKFEIKVIEKPEFIDVQKYDIYYDIFKNEIKNISDDMEEDDELIVNMASGTPAMKSALLILATLSEYKFLPIQVSTPLGKMNSKHDDRDEYDAELYFEYDDDNETGSPNRCEEVRCLNLIKLLKIDMIKKHINAYDYHAALQLGEELKEEISEDAYRLLKIADAREKLNFNAISKIMMEKHYDIYPIRDSGKMKLFEYACVLQLKLKKEEYADFIRAITPLIVDLFEQILKLKFNITVADYCDIRKGVETWNIGKLHNNGLFYILNTAYSDRCGFRSGPVYSENLAYIIKDKSSDDTLKGKIDEIISIEKNIRNLAAHQIVSVTEQSVIDKTGKSSQDIMNIIKYLIVQAGVGAGKDDWDTYDKLNQMIITALE